MTKTHIPMILTLVLVLAAVLPGTAEARLCGCELCDGNLLAPCEWPGHGRVYCVDFWEFNCFMGPWAADSETDVLTGAEGASCGGDLFTPATPDAAALEASVVADADPVKDGEAVVVDDVEAETEVVTAD
ncbi:MAG: hypothetical protein AAGN66_11880 [Acidobacteriota bacterium]